MKRGPVPFRRDFASQDDETPSSLATWTACRRGSISLVLPGATMAHLLSLLEMDRRCSRGLRKKSEFLRQIPAISGGLLAPGLNLKPSMALMVLTQPRPRTAPLRAPSP